MMRTIRSLIRGVRPARWAPSRWTRCSIAGTTTPGASRAFSPGSPRKAWRAGNTRRRRRWSPSDCSRHMLKREVSPRYARLLNNATHWGFGLAAGAGYGLA